MTYLLANGKVLQSGAVIPTVDKLDYPQCGVSFQNRSVLHAALLLSLWISAALVAKYPCSDLGHPLSPGKSEISLVIGKYLCVVRMFPTYEQYLLLNGKVGA